MQVNFKFEPSDIVRMKIGPNDDKYMVLSLIHDNGGNCYKIFNGETELVRSEFELEKILPKRASERKTGFKKHHEIQDFSGEETKGIQTDD